MSPTKAIDTFRGQRRLRRLNPLGAGKRLLWTLVPLALAIGLGCDSTESPPDPKPRPRTGEPCNPTVDATCCVDLRPLRCEGVGTTGVWYLGDAGCPCSTAPICGGAKVPQCPGEPDNSALPKDAQ